MFYMISPKRIFKKSRVTLFDLARKYTDLVRLEKEIPSDEYKAKDQANALRTKYHELLMQKMREEKIDFSDRFDAMHKAFEIVNSQPKAS